MKIKKLISLCKHNKFISLMYDRERDQQWLSDGHGIFLLDVMPVIDTQCLCMMYDIDDKQQEKIAMYDKELPEYLILKDTTEDETEAEMLGLSINLNGGTLVPIMTEEGILYIDRKYFEPLTDNQENTWRFTLRHDSMNRPLIIVKLGLFVIAAVYTFKVPEMFIEKLETLYKQTALAIENENEHKETPNTPPDRS